MVVLQAETNHEMRSLISIMPKLSSLLRHSFLLLGYTGLALWIGEIHPFTLVPMYNQFPNWSYAYYLTNEKQEMIPIKTHFNYHAGSLSHLFCGIAAEKKIAYGNMMESEEDLAVIGTRMLFQLKPFLKKDFTGEQIQIHRKTFFIQHEQISSRDQILASMKRADFKQQNSGYDQK